MADLPDDPKKIRARVRRYERALRDEKRKCGVYNDGAGKRYLLGPLYLVMGDLDGALGAFAWFEREFDDDAGDPGHRLCWALALHRAGRDDEAIAKLRQAMLLNRYLIPRLLGEDVGDLHVAERLDELEAMHLDYIPAEFFAVWTNAELNWAAGLYRGQEFSAVRSRSIEIERLLQNEPRGDRRTRLVKELFGLRVGRLLRPA